MKPRPNIDTHYEYETMEYAVVNLELRHAILNFLETDLTLLTPEELKEMNEAAADLRDRLIDAQVM